MSMVLTAVDHLNQAKAEATSSSERCAIKTEETGTPGTVNEEGANTSTSGEISIGSALLSNANVDSDSMAFGSGEADAGDNGSVTVASSGNAHQQAGSIAMTSASITTRVITPRRSKRVPKGLCDQAMTNPDSSAAIRSNAIDNNTETGVTRKGNAADSSTKSRKKSTAARESFEGREKELIDFIDEFGHCNVPQRYSVDPSLGQWCNTMRSAYKKIQQGQKPKKNLTQDQIERLEEIGFKWKLANTTTFEQRCHDLEAYKNEFGHCNVPRQYSANPSLGTWCNTMRYAYNQIQQGQTPSSNLTPDQIARLEDAGFIWNNVQETFEQRCHDLEAFKSKFRHYSVPHRYSANPSLGHWYSKTKCAYKKIQQGQTPERNLTQEQIARLEEIGFK